MPLSDLYEGVEADVTESGADWTATTLYGSETMLPFADEFGEDFDWLEYLTESGIFLDSGPGPGGDLATQTDTSGLFEGMQTNPWEYTYTGGPWENPGNVQGYQIAEWLAQQGYGGDQTAVNWFMNQDFVDQFDSDVFGGYMNDIVAQQQYYASQEAQMWENYNLWQDINLEAYHSSISELLGGYEEGMADIQQNKADQLRDILGQRRSAESAAVASLTDLRRQAGRSGFASRGMESAMQATATGLGGYTTSASTVVEMSDQALADLDTQFSSSTEQATMDYLDEWNLQIQEMQGNLELWESQFQSDMEGFYSDWVSDIIDTMTDISSQYDLSGGSGFDFDLGGDFSADPGGDGDDIIIDDTVGGCSEGSIWNPSTGMCENQGPIDQNYFDDCLGYGASPQLCCEQAGGSAEECAQYEPEQDLLSDWIQNCMDAGGSEEQCYENMQAFDLYDDYTGAPSGPGQCPDGMLWEGGSSFFAGQCVPEEEWGGSTMADQGKGGKSKHKEAISHGIRMGRPDLTDKYE